jgi:chromate transporter
MYIGWVKTGRAGAALVAGVFIAPSFSMAVAVAAAYLKFGQLPWIQDMFYVVGRRGNSNHQPERLATFPKNHRTRPVSVDAVRRRSNHDSVDGSEIVWVFLFCGVLSMVVKKPPSFTKSSMRAWAPAGGWWLTGIQGTVSAVVLGTLTLFFLKAGAFVFGSGLAIVPFLYGGVVREYHWLNERQFLDAIAVAMITPGPVVITPAFISLDIWLRAWLVGPWLQPRSLRRRFSS